MNNQKNYGDFIALKPVIAVTIALLFSEKPLYGYTDPGSGTLIWQIIVAGIVGVGFEFNRLKKRVQTWRRFFRK